MSSPCSTTCGHSSGTRGASDWLRLFNMPKSNGRRFRTRPAPSCSGVAPTEVFSTGGAFAIKLKKEFALHPSAHRHLAASSYEPTKKRQGKVNKYIFFFPSDATMSLRILLRYSQLNESCLVYHSLGCTTTRGSCHPTAHSIAFAKARQSPPLSSICVM